MQGVGVVILFNGGNGLAVSCFYDRGSELVGGVGCWSLL